MVCTIKFYDTCALLNLLDKAFAEEFAVSDITLHEIEHIKTSGNKDGETKYKARKLSRLLDENYEKYHVVFFRNEYLEEGFTDTNDMKIVSCAYNLHCQSGNVIFISDDICLKNLARKVFKLPVESSSTEENIYRGYRELYGNTQKINDAFNEFNITADNWNKNEYLIIHNTDDDSAKEMRFDGEKFVNLKLPPSKIIKAKNSLQRCALDILMNPDISIAAILGTYGSGKTFLSMRMALYNVLEKGYQSKLLGCREPRGEGKDVGFLPGSLNDKTNSFFLPLAQQLDGGEFELESLKQRGVLEANIPYYMKGTTYNDTIILADEAEDLTEKQIRLIGTRLGSNSKIYFSGDYRQSVINASDGNALVRMCNEFKGNPNFACIYLDSDVRSEASKMFADLFTS
ncbi:PhoH family protein [Lachnospiraceae bacterium 54-53]